MKNRRRRFLTFFLTCLLIMGFVGACSKSDVNGSSQDANENSTTTSGQGSSNISGNLMMVGSTSMEKLATASAEAFMNKYPNVTISPEFIGSSGGIEAVINKTADIGNSSRDLTDKEKTSGAVENIVAIDGIAVIVNVKNTVVNLTKEQLVQIYTGTKNNWSAFGGPDEPIVVVGREAGSGTRGAFEELLGITDQCKYANEISNTGGVMAKVTSIKGAIGYVSLDVLDDTVKAVKINDVAATPEDIKAGKYLLSRPFVMATNGPISQQNQLVQTFFEFLKSDEGIKVIKDSGLITVDE